MICSCGGDSEVQDSRPVDGDRAVRRRRRCKTCGALFTSYEVRDGMAPPSMLVRIDFVDIDGKVVPRVRRPVYLCPCGNEARYRTAGTHDAPCFCGICDIVKNEGKGERV